MVKTKTSARTQGVGRRTGSYHPNSDRYGIIASKKWRTNKASATTDWGKYARRMGRRGNRPPNVSSALWDVHRGRYQNNPGYYWKPRRVSGVPQWQREGGYRDSHVTEGSNTFAYAQARKKDFVQGLGWIESTLGRHERKRPKGYWKGQYYVQHYGH